MMIDLRSDTVTKPTPQMLEAMMQAKVGDDVYEEDDTVNALQAHAARLFGKEAALFCPSGTMTNQIAIKVHTQPGDELICADNAHVYKYEGGGVAFNSGVQIKQLVGDRGRITAQQVTESINVNDVHFPATRLVCLENTSNRGGGSVYSLAEMQHMASVCKQHNLQLHLDGARIFNAIVASDYDALQVGACFDSLSICLSKGLGAPVGSLVLGTKECINKAKRVRKVFGGGMRQAGFLAAAGLYALEHHVDRLMEDHLKAKFVGDTLSKLSWVKSVMPVETSIVIVQTHSPAEADRIQASLKQDGILCGRISPDQLRMVFHLDVSNNDTELLTSRLTAITN
ncbi:MAG: low-specificity L-threonine aldolase [Bacteroidota bacterium]